MERKNDYFLSCNIFDVYEKSIYAYFVGFNLSFLLGLEIQ